MRVREALSPPNISLAANVALAGTAIYLAARLRQERAKPETDSKTGLLTYPALQERVNKIAGQSQRASDLGRVHGLAFIEIDDFGSLNKELTHPGTDQAALLPVVEVLNKNIRPDSDLASRFGGDEFLLFLPDTNVVGTLTVSRKIQGEVNAIKPNPRSERNIGLTIACMEFPQGGDFEGAVKLLSRSALRAKQTPGKNQIVTPPLPQLSV